MAKPRVFISSTFYDLRQVRTDLDQFIMALGYEPVRNEEGDIPYGQDEELEKYCYEEIKKLRHFGFHYWRSFWVRFKSCSLFCYATRNQDSYAGT